MQRKINAENNMLKSNGKKHSVKILGLRYFLINNCEPQLIPWISIVHCNHSGRAPMTLKQIRIKSSQLLYMHYKNTAL
jgi:hypothetical protein